MSSPSLEPLKLVFLFSDPQGDPYKDSSFGIVTLPPKSNVCDFREAIKVKNPNQLSSVDPSQLKVYKNKAAFDRKDEPLKLLSVLDNSFGTDEENALIVVVPSKGLRGSRRSRIKTLSVEATNQKFLNAVASQLYLCYDFPLSLKANPTIGDVFAAKDGREKWAYRSSKKSPRQGDDDTTETTKGRWTTDLPLPEFFSKDEWEALILLDDRMNTRMYDGDLPPLCSQRMCVVLSESDYHPDLEVTLKFASFACGLCEEPRDLEVRIFEGRVLLKG
jgi:hypothetical protein